VGSLPTTKEALFKGKGTPMTSDNTAVLTTLHQGPLFAPANTSGAGAEASWSDWSSWGGLVEALLGPAAMPLAIWIVLGGVLGVCLSFVVRDLGIVRAFAGGLFGGILAGAALLMAAQRLGDMVGHGLAGAVLLLCSALMVVRAKRRAAGGKAKSQAAPPAEAADPSTPDPSAASKPPAPSSPAPAPAPKAKPADPAPAAEKQDAANAPAPEKEAAPEKKPAPTAPAPAPPKKPAPIAIKKPTPAPSAAPGKAAGGGGAGWLQDHT